MQPLIQRINSNLNVCVCILENPARNAHAPYCRLLPASLYKILPLYLIKGTIFGKKGYWIYFSLGPPGHLYGSYWGRGVLSPGVKLTTLLHPGPKIRVGAAMFLCTVRFLTARCIIKQSDHFTPLWLIFHCFNKLDFSRTREKHWIVFLQMFLSLVVIYTYIYLCVCVCVCVRARARVFVCVFVRAHACACGWVCVRVYV